MDNLVDHLESSLSSLKRTLRPRHPKFGTTYTAVSTSDDSSSSSSSGLTVRGVLNVSTLASQLLSSIGPNRCCAIAIANASGRRLVDPNVHVCSGHVRPAPYIIEHGYTGLIGAYKSAQGVIYNPRGTSGVITYELDGGAKGSGGGGSGLQLQVMWSVPNDFHLFDSWVNVSVGERTAGPELFKAMYKGKVGEVVKAKDTCRVFKVGPDVRVEMAMSEGGRCTLVVKLFRD